MLNYPLFQLIGGTDDKKIDSSIFAYQRRQSLGEFHGYLSTSPYPTKKALKQIGVQDSEVDLSSLSEEQQQMLQSVMQEIEKENDERGER